MAYGSTEGGYGAGASVLYPDATQLEFDVPDAELLFRGEYRRAGPDLVLSGQDGRHFIIPGYFSSEHRAALVAPNGARLSPDLVDLLAGSVAPGQYAQAQPSAIADVVGRVEKVVGDVTAVRNGVAVVLHVGDAIYKSDVVQTGNNSSLGVSFPDGTALNLVANTRMAINEYSYDANSNSNGALFSLVEGTFAFVAGKVAHTGDMKIATPVATMGIRGTTGWAHELTPNEIATVTATLGDVTYSFAVVDDFGVNRHGIYDLIVNGNVVGSIGDTNVISYLDQDGHFVTGPLRDAQRAFAQEMFREFFQWLPLSNVTPRSINGHDGSSTPPPNDDLNLLPQFINFNGNTFNYVVPVNGPNGVKYEPLTLTVTFDDLLLTVKSASLGAQNTSVQVTEPSHPVGSSQQLMTTAMLPFTDTNPGNSFTVIVTGVTPAGNANGLPDASTLLGYLQLDGVVQNPGSPNGVVDFTFVAPVGSFEYLSQNETVTLNYTVQITDAFGLTTIQTVSVTVVGTNEAPVIEPLLVPDPGPIQAPAGTPDPSNPGHFLPLVESNNVTFKDPNFDDTHIITFSFDAAQSNVSAADLIGNFSASLLQDSTGGTDGIVHWQFTVDPALVNALAPGKGAARGFRYHRHRQLRCQRNRTDRHHDRRPESPPTTTFIWLPDSPSPPDSSGNWNMPGDWSGDVVPGAGDTAKIENAVKVTVNDDETVDNLVLAAGAILNIVDHGKLTVLVSIDNAGLIELNSSGADPTLAINGIVTLSGGGTIEMLVSGEESGNAGVDLIAGVGTNSKLINLDNLIIGTGTIGQGNGLTLVNDGTIDATGLIIIDTGANHITNTLLSEASSGGVLEATAGGTLEIFSDIDNTGGTIAAHGEGSTVQLSDVTVTGGELDTDSPTSTAGGMIEIVATDGVDMTVFDGSTNAVTIDGYVRVDAGANLELIWHHPQFGND